MSQLHHPPVIDLSPLVNEAPNREEVIQAIDQACREWGFFIVTGHGVDPALVDTLLQLCSKFFALPEEEKARIAMPLSGSAWRGWFPLGGELTSGVADHKEGIYFGTECSPEQAHGRPMHGPNMFPEVPELLGATVRRYLEELTSLGHLLICALDDALGANGQLRHLTEDPLILFRAFIYPPHRDGWGVGEHTDYGLLTLLATDGHPGLQVRVGEQWISVDPVPNSFVCNLGDMLERATGGRYRSTPHRVRNLANTSRISLPFFFDPGWESRVMPLDHPAEAATSSAHQTLPSRWDGADPLLFEGTYGEYVWSKVGKVFPRIHHA